MTPTTAISRLRALNEARTKGKWRQHLVDDTSIIASDGSDIASTWPEGGQDADVDFNSDTEQHEADAAAIVAAVNALGPLLDCADLIAEKTQGDAFYYLNSIMRQMREFQEVVTTSEGFYGPTLASEVMADNMDWLDCFIDAITKARAALAALSLIAEEGE